MQIDIPGMGPVRPGKIVCVGRNYAAHIDEMNWGEARTPVLFLKPTTALIPSGATIRIPAQSDSVHHEAELVLVVGATASRVSADSALGHIAAYALGLDMTARDIQKAAKDAGEPWSVSKGFDTFAPLGGLAPASAIADPQKLSFEQRVNGELRQRGDTSLMLSPVAQLVSSCSEVFTLEPGDLIYTGTPKGVARVLPGDTLEVTGDGLETLTVGVE